MGEKFYLRFSNEEEETLLIDEPFGYDSAKFIIKQEDKRYARDISFSDGEIDLEFGKYRKHYLEKILYHIDRYGYEAKISLIIEKEGESIGLDFDCKDSSTDGLTYFKCKLIQDAKLQVIKRNKDIKVDLFSDKDLFGNPIVPMVPEKILLKAKPVVQNSRWDKKSDLSKTIFSPDNLNHPVAVYNPMVYLDTYGLEDSLTPFQIYTQIPNDSAEPLREIKDDYLYIRANQNLKNLKIKIAQNFTARSYGFAGSGIGNATGGFYIAYGDDINTATVSAFFTYNISNPLGNEKTYTNSNTFEFTIPILNRGQKVWIYYEQKVRGLNPSLRHEINITGEGYIKATGVETAFNTISEAFRLSDVMKHLIKSISGLDITAPRFEQGGEFYDQYLLNGNFLRNIKDKPFYVTLKQIEEGLTEFNADYEIQNDGKIFFGLHRDFYTDNEIAFFNSTQFESFSKTFNPRFAVNKFVFEYKNYQSQKENSEENTADSVHGESEWKFANMNTENAREISVGWIRDAFLIESTRRKGFEEKNNTATQDDDKLFILDVYPKERIGAATIDFTETAFLQHSYDDNTGFLTLRNDGSFSFAGIGVTVDSFVPFYITPVQPNNGSYTVEEVASNYIVLQPNYSPGNPASSANNGERFTTFRYSIPTSILAGINWTDQEFTSIDGIENGNNYSNLRFSIKRNMLKYHLEYLTACNYYHRNEYLASTFYKNNPDAHTVYNGSDVEEGSDLIPNSNMLSPVLFKDCVFITPFQDYKILADKIRTIRGFVRAIEPNGHVIRFYPKNVAYDPAKEALTIEGEEKHEPVLINIVSVPNGVSINYEYQTARLKYQIDGDSVLLMDNENELLYNPVFWNRIAVNGAQAANLNELQEWLSLL